ncbi:MAG TPA: hypothetical protein VJB61_02890 [Actinomycetota bacterium]
MLELIDLLTILATSAGIGDDDRYELASARDQVATRMPAVELLVCAGLLWEASDRLALDPATRAACHRWSLRVAGLIAAAPDQLPLAIAS